MGYGSVFLVIGTIFIAGILLMSMDSATSDADQELNEYYFKELARDAATTGLELTVRRLAASAHGVPPPWNTAWADAHKFNTTPYQSGAFRVTITPVPVGSMPAHLDPAPEFGDLVDVTARGVSGFTRDPETGDAVPISHVIFARYLREYADGGIPPAFRHIIASDRELYLSGNAEVRAVSPTFNANVHANGTLRTNGNSFVVEGYGSYTTAEATNQENNCLVYPGDPFPPDGNFCPNQDYNEAELNVFWKDSVDVPAIDILGLRNLAQTSSGSWLNTGDGSPIVIDGEVAATAVIDFRNPGSWPWLGTFDYNCLPDAELGPCGTAKRPFIMFVEGPIDIVNRVEFRGYGNIIATGTVDILPDGNGGGVFGQLNADDETTLLLATNQDIRIGQAGGTTCTGLGPGGPSTGNLHCASADGTYTHGVTLYANGDVTYTGTVYMIGGVVVDDLSFSGSGTPTLIYSSPSEETIDPGFDYNKPIGPVLIAYSEW